MHSFHYKENNFYCEEVCLSDLVSREQTPLYVYSKGTVLRHYRDFKNGISQLNGKIFYAVKANSNLSILKTFIELGSYFDTVSMGEIMRVIEAGGSASRCSFAGVGKTDEEIAFALENGIYSFHIESFAELYAIDNVAKKLGKKAKVSARVNPNVNANTHEYISTGKKENKFGIDQEEIEEFYNTANSLANIEICGVQMHIGSQITSTSPFKKAIQKMLPLVKLLKSRYNIKYYSIGGGLGIPYENALQSADFSWWNETKEKETSLTIKKFTAEITKILTSFNLPIFLEPGRSMVGNAGVLLTKVLYVKESKTKRFVVIDAAMNDLIRPALYQGYHQIVPVTNRKFSGESKLTDIVGPICESGDFLCKNRELPAFERGDYLAVLSSGAYGFTMSSNYNSRLLAKEILVSGDNYKVIRRRQEFSDLIRQEII